MYSKYSFGSGLFTNTQYGRFGPGPKRKETENGGCVLNQINSSQKICGYLRGRERKMVTRLEEKVVLNYILQMYTSASSLSGVKWV